MNAPTIDTEDQLDERIAELEQALKPLAMDTCISRLRDRTFGDVLDDTDSVWISVRAGEIRRAAALLGIEVPADLASPPVQKLCDG